MLASGRLDPAGRVFLGTAEHAPTDPIWLVPMIGCGARSPRMGHLTLARFHRMSYSCLMKPRIGGEAVNMPGDPATPGSSAGKESAEGAPSRRGRTRRRAFGTWSARAALGLTLLLGLVTSATPFGRAAARGTLLLWPVLSASQPQLYATLGEGERHTSLTIASNAGTVYLDVYAPTQPTPLVPGTRGAMLIIPGVGDNRTDPQLTNLSKSLAENGVVVMEVTTTTLINFDLRPTDSDAVVRAFGLLAQWPGVDPRRVGIVGISAGAGLVYLAAADPRVRDQVAYMVDFGGYFDVVDLLRDFGRRALEIDGKLEPWVPSTVPLAVLSNVLADALPQPEASELQAAFALNNPQPLTEGERASLTPEGQAAYDLLAGDMPSRVDADLTTLKAFGGDRFTALSPGSVIDQIQAPVYLLHDRNDNFIPVTEARDCAAELVRLHHPHDYVEVAIIMHAEVSGNKPLGELTHDAPALARLLVELLRYAS
jgi:acetyl esterase/lipase